MLEQEIEQNFQQEIAKEKHDDPFRFSKINTIKNHNTENPDALESMKKMKENQKRENLLEMLKQNWKTHLKTMIDFDKNECNSIKFAVAVKGNTTVDVTSRFIKRKMLMFAKISLKLLVYDLINVICFQMEEVRKIYDQHDIIKCHMYLNLTNTNSYSRFFNFICKKECNIKESESRKLIAEILKHSKILERLDISDKFWQ